MAQPAPPVCPQDRHPPSHDGDDRGRPLSAVERDGEPGAVG